MGIFSRFERRVEDGFDGMNDKFFDSPISPVQITKKAEKQMRREKMVGAGKEYAPTLYTVLVNPDDDKRLFGAYPTLAGETETYLRAKAAEEGLVMDGAPLVRFIVDDSLKPGKFDVIAEMVSAPIIAQLRNEELQRYGLPPQNPAHVQDAIPAQGQPYANETPRAQQYAPDSDIYSTEQDDYQDQTPSPRASSVAEPIPVPNNTVLLDQGAGAVRPQAPTNQMPKLVNLATGRTFSLANSRTLIGRATNCNIVLDDLTASRTHAEIFSESPLVWVLADLGSANGTLVNGRHIASIALNDGDRITIGTTTFVFTLQ